MPATAKRNLLCCWMLFAVVNLWAMWALPGAETIPFHFVWISIALVFGLISWPTSAMISMLAGVTVTTGLILWHHAVVGETGFQEIAEVPLMAALFLVMVWHVRRRQQTLVELERVAELERRRAETQGLFVRLGSHELRTSITVARGYVELIGSAHDDEQTRADTAIVLDELGKLTRLTGRLTTLMQLHSAVEPAPVDLDSFVEQLVRRWKPVADRRWSAESTAGFVNTDADRLRAAMDSLIENAIAFTRTGDRISARAWREQDSAVVEVSDTGSGISPDHLGQIFEWSWSSRNGDDGSYGKVGGSGLGLAIVRMAVDTLGGTVGVRSDVGQGTTFRLTLPPWRAVSAAPSPPRVPFPPTGSAHR